MEILDKSKNECNRGKVEVAFIVKKKKQKNVLGCMGTCGVEVSLRRLDQMEEVLLLEVNENRENLLAKLLRIQVEWIVYRH